MNNRILINASTFPRWKGDDVPIFILEFAKALAIEGKGVYVLAPHYKGAKIHEQIQGVEIFRFVYFLPFMENLSNGKAIVENLKSNPFNYLLIPLYFLSNSCAFLYLNLRYKFSVVNIHWIIPSGIIGVLFRPIFRYKLVITSHGGDIFDFQKLGIWKLIKPIMAFILHNLNLFIVVSQAIAAEAIKLFGEDLGEKTRVISMGIDFERFNQVDNTQKEKLSEKINIVFVGRLVRRKGVDIIIEACKLLDENKYEFTFEIVGDGPEREELSEMVSKYNLEDRIKFVGFLQHDQVIEKLAKANCFIGPSRSEGLGLVFLEAMATGLPVIATDVDGIPDIVKDRETGLLVPVDDPRAVFEAVKALREDEVLCSKILKGGNQMARAHDWQAIATKFLSAVS